MDRSGSKGYQLDLDRIWIGLRSNFQILDRIGSRSTFELLDRIGIISKKIGSDPTLVFNRAVNASQNYENVTDRCMDGQTDGTKLIQ